LEISGNIGKSLEVITSIICIRIADIPGSRAKNKLFFLNTMHNAGCIKRSGKLFVKNMLILQHQVAMLYLETTYNYN